MDNIPENFKPYVELFSSSSSNNDDVCDHTFVPFDDRVNECVICSVEQIYNRFEDIYALIRVKPRPMPQTYKT